MRKLAFVLIMFCLAVSVFAERPLLSVGTRFGAPAPETGELSVAVGIPDQEFQVYGAIGGGLVEDFGIVTVGVKAYPYTTLLNIFYYAGVSYAWSGSFELPGDLVVIKNDDKTKALGPEFGLGISPIDEESGAFLGGMLLPEFYLGYNSITGRVVFGFSAGFYF